MATNAQQVDFLLSGVRDDDGTPLDSGKVYFYDIGTTNTTIDGNGIIWSERDKSVEASNPLTLGSDGCVLGDNIIYADGSYTIKITDSVADGENTIDTFDADYSANKAATTLGVSLNDDHAGDLSAALAAIGAVTETHLFIDVDETITGDETVTSNITLHFIRGAVITVTATKTLTVNGTIDAGEFQIFASTGSYDDIVDYGTGEANAAWFGSSNQFDNAVDSLTATHTTQTALTVSANYALNAAATIPTTMRVKFLPNGKIALGNLALTFNGDVEAGRWQIFDENGTGVVTFGNHNPTPLMPEWWGAVGDDSDESAELVSLFAAAAGQTILFGRGKVYQVNNTELVLLAGTELDLNTSTLKFEQSGDTRCLRMRSNTRVHNGTVQNVTGGAASSGEYQAPIIIGLFVDASTGADGQIGLDDHNIIIENITIVNDLADGNGIAVFSRCNAITIDNIRVNDNANIGRPIMCHWSSVDGTPSNTTTDPTFHPHNISISNVTCGDLTSTTSGMAIVWLSGVYNVSVDNVYTESCEILVENYAGDKGSVYVNSNQTNMVGKNVSITNCASNSCRDFAVVVNGNPTSEAADSAHLDMSCIISNVKGTGTAADSGIVLSTCTGVVIDNCDLRSFPNGIKMEAGFQFHTNIRNTRIQSCTLSGISINHATDIPQYINIENCVFNSCNSAGAAAASVDSAGIYVGKAYHVSIRDCKFGSGAETMKHSVLATASSHWINLQNNFTSALESGTGVCYQLGAVTDSDTIRATGYGNTRGSTSIGSALHSGAPISGAYGSLGVATLDANGTPPVEGGTVFKTNGATAITDFDDGHVGQVITIICDTSAIKITHGVPIVLNGSVDYDMTDTDTLTLMQYSDGNWYELSRSVN